MSGAVRKVVIIGRDAAAWLSALTLQRSFGRTGVEIELVELPSTLGPEDGFVTLPSQRAFHQLLGLDETRLLRASKGVYSLGQRFSNWSGAAAPFIHAYDTHGVALNRVDFFQHWLRARASGLSVPLEDFSLGAVAARQGRYVIFNEATSGFSRATHGYNLSAIPYLVAIGKVALHEGLRHSRGEVREVRHDGRQISAITLADGRELKADLFIDASGREARLLRELEPGDNFESWQHWLPFDRRMVASAPALHPLPAFNQVSAFKSGWIGIFPLADRTVLVTSYASAATGEADIAQLTSALSGLRIEGDAVTEQTRAGGRRQHWLGNCVAVGDTATRLDPLDANHLQLLQTGLSWLVTLFPTHPEDMPESAVYNQKMSEHAAGVRDFQVAHMHLNQRYGDPAWDAPREQAPPASLAQKLDLFRARGVVAMNDNETFQEENWTSVLAGHGLLPQAWDPLADAVPEQELIGNFQRMLGFIGTEVQSMPTLQDHMELTAPQQPESDYIFG
ncbi:tryptophan 7-halogenase [Marinihelvus fidelis]|uniref:Tryptophan 7-halogenase n=1 Tax=Marinihelvus fidelis TaxID=2613842 RepID=A0A5N0T809_9GAMM|nr:tryptophan 7-halogenase [Marinihelvus fidelis]KAA9130901.1 tryptophan 7-halogenase [Marinihelvus fidelis]